MFDLINIFDTFLPQLLLYPNPTDPLNNDAASLQLKSEDQYTAKIKEYVGLYASAHLQHKQSKTEEETSTVAVIAEEEKNNASGRSPAPPEKNDGKPCNVDVGDGAESSADELK